MAKTGKEPDHIPPISLVKTVLKNGTHQFSDQYLKNLKLTVNQDWNFRMVLRETNRQWGIDIAKLNRSYHENTIE
jgi:hypothetical protein